MTDRKIGKSLLAGFLAIILTLSLAAGMAPEEVNAERMDELSAQLEILYEKEEEINAEISSLQGQLSDNLSDMEAVVAQKNTIDQEIFMLYEKMANLNEQIATYNLLIADKQDELDKEEARLAQLNEDNKERIRAMEENGHLSYWSVLFKANSFADFLDRLNMVEEIAAADQRRLKELSDSAKAVEEAKVSLETEKAGMEQTKKELEESQVQLEEKRAEADRLLAELIAVGAEYEQLLHEAEKKAAAIGSDIDSVESKQEALEREQWLSTSVPSQPGSSGGSHIVDGLTWLTPCNYRLLTSPFGWRVHPVYGDWRFHYGVDLAGPIGTPIVATRSGVVTVATYDSSAGYYVTIDHQDGFSSKYLHMTHYVVGAGDYVTAGQVIGYMGSTGTSTGSHLHFSILYNGEHQNPMDYIS